MKKELIYALIVLIVIGSTILLGIYLKSQVEFGMNTKTTPPTKTSTTPATTTSLTETTTSPTWTTKKTQTQQIHEKHPFYPDKYSRYGGWLKLRLKPTGFFHIEKVNNTYWFVDPEGYVFISKGVNHVNYMGDHSPALGYSPYYANILRKYGSINKWINITVNRLLKWGFNTIGAWSSRELYKYMPYTVNLNILGNYGFEWTTGKMPDIFGEEFVEYVEKKVYFNCRPLANDSLLLGYFLDNELRWGPDWRSSTHLLDDFFKLPPSSPGKKVAVDIVKEAYNNDITRLNKDLGTKFKSFDELLSYYGPLPDTEAIGKARTEFVRRYAERYFNVTVSIIKKYDPNHLILGIRFSGLPTRTHELELFKVMAKYVDVISINLYNTVVPPKDKLMELYKIIKKPIMITEFSYRARDSGLPNTKGAGLTFNTQTERADATYRFVSELMSLRFVVGYHWFQYYDQPKEGRFDGEDSNYGIVNINDEPYLEMVNMFIKLNTMVEEIHLSLKIGN
ncbi:MAG: beta-agarase [Staphylothermus sp.]|nr:beta-agarase [Staphylothermus sp.]